MRKVPYLLSFLLLTFLFGALVLGAAPSWQRRAGSRDGTAQIILRRTPVNRVLHRGNSSAEQPPPPPLSPVNISYQRVQPMLGAIGDFLPAELKKRSPAEMETIWPVWVVRHDQETRARLTRGDEDTLVNFLVLGTSFTRQEPFTEVDFASLPASQVTPQLSSDSSAEAALLLKRLDDLLRGLANPGNNERLVFLSHLVEKQGFHPRETYGVHPDLAERARLKAHVLASVARVLDEQEHFRLKYARAHQSEDHPEDVEEVSTLYRFRGLSQDTSLLPNMALEESLKVMQSRGLLAPGSVRRVAVIGPGLDFTDKSGGYDFYPQQTIQCFALVDTLFRLGLARRGDLKVTTFDISERVNDHLRSARRRAQLGQAYVLQLPQGAQELWNPATILFWRQFGDEIGTPVAPIRPPTAAGKVETRAVQIPPGIVSMIMPVDLDIVTQHLDVPPQEGFDLIIATNVFCYFDGFEQSLALANTQSMLRPGGFLLSNNALPVLLPSLQLHSVDSLTVFYSERPNDADDIVWYQRSAE